RYAGFRDRCLQPLGHPSNFSRGNYLTRGGVSTTGASGSGTSCIWLAQRDRERLSPSLRMKCPPATLPKKRAEQCGTLVLEHAAAHLGTMVEPRVAQQVTYRPRHPRLLIPRTEDHALHAREYERARAHRARLERHVERAMVQAPAAVHARRFAY